MAKRPRSRPASPAAIAALAAMRRQRELAIAEAERLEADPDVRVVTDSGGALTSAQRQDVFAVLLARGAKSLTQAQEQAARRLERDVAAWKGVDRDTAARGGGTASKSLICDRMLIAGERVEDATIRIGIRDRVLLMALILPQFEGDTIRRWRDVVLKVTGETREETQAGCVRGACENLRLAYQEIDYATVRRAKKIMLDAVASNR